MKIRMLETRRGCEDGFTVRCYQEGETYDVAGLMGSDFIRRGYAESAETWDDFIARLDSSPMAKKNQALVKAMEMINELKR